MTAKRSRRSASRSAPRPAKRTAQPEGKRAATRGRKPRLPARPQIAVAVFDLDDTLYDCFRQRVMAAHRHAAKVMAESGVPATPAEIFRVRMEAFQTDPQLRHIDGEVCRRFGVVDAAAIMLRARNAYFSTPVGKLRLFPATLRVLRALRKRGVRNFIVSFGDPETQHAKVRALGLEREKSVEKIFYADTAHVITKEAVFRSLLRNVEPDPAKVLVVGDRPASEIRAGKSLGMHTVRIQGGEFARLAPAGPEEEADHAIGNIAELLRLPYRFGK